MSCRVPLEGCLSPVGLCTLEHDSGSWLVVIWSTTCAYVYRYTQRHLARHHFRIQQCFLLPAKIVTIGLLNSALIFVTKHGFVQHLEATNLDEVVETSSVSNTTPPSKKPGHAMCTLTEFVLNRREICQAVVSGSNVVLCCDDKVTSSWVIEAVLQESPGKWLMLFQTSVLCDPGRKAVSIPSVIQDTWMPGEQHSKPLLPVIRLVRCASPGSSSNEDVISSVFFSALFGDIPGCCVLLLGLPNGRVFWSPVARSKPDPVLLWHLEEPVVAIFKNGLPQSSKEALVILGSYGKAVIVTSRAVSELSMKEPLKGLVQRLEFTLVKTCVPTVMCRPYEFGWLHVASDGCVCHAAVVQENEKGFRITSRDTGVGNASNVALLSSSPEHVEAAVLSLDGRCFVQKWDTSDWLRSVSSPAGVSMLRSQVQSICECFEKTQELETLLAEQSEILKQLHIMANIVHLSSDILVTLSIRMLGSKDPSHLLSVKMEHFRNLQLHHPWWAFVVTLSSCFAEIGEFCVWSFPLTEEDNQEFIFPTKLSLLGRFHFPLKVECALQLTVPTSLVALKHLPPIQKQFPLPTVVKTFLVDPLSLPQCDPVVMGDVEHKRKHALLSFLQKRACNSISGNAFPEESCLTITTSEQAFGRMKRKTGVFRNIPDPSRDECLVGSGNSQVSLSVRCELPFVSIVLKGSVLAALCLLRTSLIHHLSTESVLASVHVERQIQISKEGLEAAKLLKQHLELLSRDWEALSMADAVELYLTVRNTLSTVLPIC